VTVDKPITGLLIGVFAAAVLVITFRRKTHKVVELAAWIGLVGACSVAVLGINDPQTHALTTSAAWGTSRVAGTIAGTFELAAARWISGERFVIAAWVVLLLGADVLALALVATNRQAGPRVPVNKLREWWVLPRRAGARSVQPNAASATDEINRRFNTWFAPAALAAAMWSTLLLMRLRGATGRTNPITSSIANPAVIPASTRASQVVTRVPTANRAEGGRSRSVRGKSVTRRADRRRETNGSKKRRESRLAS